MFAHEMVTNIDTSHVVSELNTTIKPSYLNFNLFLTSIVLLINLVLITPLGSDHIRKLATVNKRVLRQSTWIGLMFLAISINTAAFSYFTSIYMYRHGYNLNKVMFKVLSNIAYLKEEIIMSAIGILTIGVWVHILFNDRQFFTEEYLSIINNQKIDCKNEHFDTSINQVQKDNNDRKQPDIEIKEQKEIILDNHNKVEDQGQKDINDQKQPNIEIQEQKDINLEQVNNEQEKIQYNKSDLENQGQKDINLEQHNNDQEQIKQDSSSSFDKINSSNEEKNNNQNTQNVEQIDSQNSPINKQNNEIQQENQQIENNIEIKQIDNNNENQQIENNIENQQNQ